MTDDTFVIGDVHGHFLRLKTLLTQEGLMDEDECRLRPEVRVIQLGDLGHFGMERGTGKMQVKSPTEDKLCYWMLVHGRIDQVLWGNHDRAVISDYHAFGGYVPPSYEMYDIMDRLHEEGKIALAAEAHGFLLTHAGLHKQFKHNKVPDEWKQDPAAFAAAINAWDLELDPEPTPENVALMATRDAISVYRGGRATAGGILWRDASESLHDGYRQIFGHTAKDKVRKYHTAKGQSYCIDVGTQTNGNLVGMWLPSETIAEVHVDPRSR
jgi:hypothetical protein